MGNFRGWEWVILLGLMIAIVALAIIIIITVVVKSSRKNGTSAKGWFPDPETPGQYRYFDGEKWTELRTTSDQPPPKT